jgi:hypothetical protein
VLVVPACHVQWRRSIISRAVHRPHAFLQELAKATNVAFICCRNYGRFARHVEHWSSHRAAPAAVQAPRRPSDRGLHVTWPLGKVAAIHRLNGCETAETTEQTNLFATVLARTEQEASLKQGRCRLNV